MTGSANCGVLVGVSGLGWRTMTASVGRNKTMVDLWARQLDF
jgi:hypothetical protein